MGFTVLAAGTSIPEYWLWLELSFYVFSSENWKRPEKEKKYFENGSVYIFTKNHFELTNNRLGGKIGHVIFPEEYGYEIDVPKDLIILEQLSREIIK